MADTVTLAEAIKELRAQLEDAQREGAGKDLRFVAKSVEVELGNSVQETKLKCGKSRLLSVPRPGHRAAKAEIA